ncbi:hypothetical protein PUNSTDRAFT_87917 [Punctularia strigosozonata HHB-11173 SS5]|uniref:uncharacterized protein n=1 Tax=Punctularia strigosozonata (strain HHB-11173) TaxID=741275 RepID=UPI00044186D4|nr:uncharacterized protein PUNSTDRAFT_87917 [Punctularia strigosozonata HHB-11173 SS5]EIN08480.1 hypothetical protein PUNSTDRAFT_87917 [Punctularia strigosozonata HHB-11173 SS5]
MASNGVKSRTGESPAHSRESTESSRRSFDSNSGRIIPSPAGTGLEGDNANGGGKESQNEEELRQELARVREEKDELDTKYQGLLTKLNQMRTTLGTKIKQDAEELDRREQLLQQLNAENEDLAATVETLKSELISANEESERHARELDRIRSQALQESAQETLSRERELRETQAELERVRMEREEWEREAAQGRLREEEARADLDAFRKEWEMEREAHNREAEELAREREKAANLQSVLEDFQSAKDREIRTAVADLESRLVQVTQSLAEYKHRAHTAEMRIEETSTDTSLVQDLQRKLKEKEVLTEKLRHEAVIINEHLLEALRRLRKTSSETNVDRRLVTNIVLQYITTPRGDSKRYEMLSLLATILSWNDAERERAGLQRTGSAGPPPPIGQRTASGQTPSKGDLDKTDVTESFSKLWVEFLLTEANSATGDTSPSAIRTPSRSSFSLSVPGSPTTAKLSPTQSTPQLPKLSPKEQHQRLGVTSTSGSSWRLPSWSSKSDVQLSAPPPGPGRKNGAGEAHEEAP